MSEPRGNGPTGPQDDLAALAALDLALDELAAGDLPASPIGGEAAVLAAVAAGLRAAVPAPPPGAAERGRAAFLARAAELQGRPATAELPPPSAAPARRRRRLPARVLALAAALVVLAAVPALARQARPGSALWPVRQVGQQLRVNLADDPARRAHLRLNIAEEYLAAGAGAGERRRKAMADRAEDLVEEVLDQLDDASGARAGVERARAERLLLAVRALEHQDDPGGGSGPGSGSGDQSGGGGGGSGGGGGKGSSGGSGPGGGDDGGGSGSKRGSSGPSSGSGSGSSGSSGSGTSGSGSRRSGSGDG